MIVNAQAKAIELPAPFPIKILERTNGLEAEGNGEDAPKFHDSLWEVSSLGDDKSTLSAELDVGDILSPNMSNLPVWARPDFAAQQEFTTAQGNAPVSWHGVVEYLTYTTVGIIWKCNFKFQSSDVARETHYRSTFSSSQQF